MLRYDGKTFYSDPVDKSARCRGCDSALHTVDEKNSHLCWQCARADCTAQGAFGDAD